ncbi:hypothetical protein CAP36_12530 [Chitinophagaceae bacterium IBVUCB2]|nr:hypothetical protein CAP36_12530 [Chitinophagaceae bacterium IBVUCB2]
MPGLQLARCSIVAQLHLAPYASVVGGSIETACCYEHFGRNSENEIVMDKEKSGTTKSWISFRVKPKEYDIIHGHFSKTTCRKLSEYARNVLLQKPVVIKVRNQSADDFLGEIILLKNELNAIGNNYNQSVKRLHTMERFSEVKIWLQNDQSFREGFLKKTEQIRERMDQIYRLWLSK